MTRYTGAENESIRVLTPEQHEAATAALRRMGKTSAVHLSDKEREILSVVLDEAL